MLEIVPLHCPRCGSLSPRRLAWVHENSRVACDKCGTGFPIDKDGLVLWLAEQERHERTDIAPALPEP